MKGMKKSFVCMAVLGSMVVTSMGAEFPLRVNIDVSAKRRNQNVGAGTSGEARIENVTLNVHIRQSGGTLYTDPLSCELYVIGRQVQTGYYGIIDVVKKEFTFTQEEQRTFEFATKNYPIGRTSGNINVGGTYETYLLVVVDNKGEIVDTRSGRVIREEGIAFIRELGPMTLFDRDGNVVGKVENPGQAFKKAVPAATFQGGH